jgi:hypothetical protein
MDEFLNPKANLTPGALGSFMMLLANGICGYFPELGFRWVALVLSLLIAVSTVSAIQMAISKKAIFWLLNAMVIFVVGVGSTNIAANIEEHHYAMLTSTAYASEPATQLHCDTPFLLTPDGRSVPNPYYPCGKFVPPPASPRPPTPPNYINPGRNGQPTPQQQFFKRW